MKITLWEYHRDVCRPEEHEQPAKMTSSTVLILVTPQLVTAAELTECSLTEYPHLDAARVLQRLRPNPQVEFYTHAQRGFENIGRQLAIIQSQMEARR